MTNERIEKLENINKQKVSCKNLTYDEDGNEINKILIDIYKHYLLPKSKEKLDMSRDAVVELEHG